jgi:glycerol-3-phosphate acyltransferase PlsY
VSFWTALVAIVIGYLFGAVSFTRILGRWVLPGDDLSGVDVQLGKGTLRFNRTSASLISLKRGPGYGCLTGILDMAKAALPVLAFSLAFPDHDYEYLVAAAAVVGHNYPVFYRFRGGAGMSPYLGGLAILDWLAVPVVTLLGTLTGVLSRNVVVSYISGVVWLFPWFWWRGAGWEAFAYATVINVAVWPTIWPVMKDLTRMQKAGEIDRKEAMKLLTSGHPSLNRDKYLPD